MSSAVPGERLSPAASGSSLQIGVAARRSGPPWSQRAVLAGVAAACVAVVVALLTTAFPSQVGSGAAPIVLGTTIIYSSSGTEAPPLPASPATPARHLRPRDATLQPADLPAGARVTKEGPASFSPSASPPPSWDVVMRPDPAQPADYEFAESLAVVYASDRVAASAMAAVGAAELAGGARELATGSSLGDQQTVWLEQAPSRPSAIVRVAWRSMNVVGEVSVLAPAGPAEVQRALDLAQLEQTRIGAPVPFDEQK
jgi:hypothetical protein